MGGVNMMGGMAMPGMGEAAPTNKEGFEQGQLGWADDFDKKNPQSAAVELPPLERMHRLCGQGALDEVKGLAKNKKLLTDKGAVGNVALHFAAQGGQDHIVGFLVSQGADVNVQNDVGDSPLHQAAWKGKIDAIKVLLTSGADRHLKNKEGKTPCDLARTDDVKAALPEFDEKDAAKMVVMAGDDSGGDDW